MKYEFRYCHIFCLVNALARFVSVSGAGIIPKFVCQGDSVEVFQNITFNNCSSVVSLYIHGQRNTLIASWSFETCSRNRTFVLPDYRERVFLHGNGIISIHDVDPWDQAKYIVNCQMGNMSTEDVVQIIVMAAPANDCIPRILHMGSSLVASLKAHSCGKPVATLYWKGYGDVPKTREPVLKLKPGNQDGTYYACIEGPALTCVRNALDYCSKFTLEENESPPLWDVKMAIFIVVGIVLGISLILATAAILIRKHCRKNTLNGQQTVHSDKTVELWRKCFENLSGQQTYPLDKDHNLRINSFDSLKWEDIKQLSNDERRQLFKILCDKLEKDDTATKPTLSELAITLCGKGSGTEDNQWQLESSQENVTSRTCISRSSGTFNEPGHSGIQPRNNVEQDANPKQDMALAVRVQIEDSDSEDKCIEPLLTDHAKM